MSALHTPNQRAYVHKACDGSTIVSGDAFRSICDPLGMVSQTLCPTCNGFFPLCEFVWADTNERVDLARARWLAEAPPGVKSVNSHLWFIVAIAIGAPLGAGIGWLVSGGLPNVLIGAGVGAIAVCCCWAGCISLIMRYVLDWDWRRMK